METVRSLENEQIIEEEDDAETDSFSDSVGEIDIQELEQEVYEIDKTIASSIIFATAQRDASNYDYWHGIAKTIKKKPPFSHEENVARTRVLQAQKKECERILEEEIVPLLGDRDQAIKIIKEAIARREEIPSEEVRFHIQDEHSTKLSHPLGDALFRFTNRDKVLKALQEIAGCFIVDTEDAKKFNQALFQLSSIDDERKDSIKEIVEHNLGLVLSLANKYQPYSGTNRAVSMSLWDMFQEGVIGCMRGADTYDPNTGYKFSTYVVSCVKQAMQLAVSTKE